MIRYGFVTWGAILLMQRPGWGVVAIGLLFSIPPGVGIVLATLRVTDGSELLLGILAGLLTAIIIFGFVLMLGLSGEPDQSPHSP